MTSETTAATARHGHARGIALCVGGMLLFSAGNGFLKVALADFSVAQTLMLRLWALLAMALVAAALRGGIIAAFSSRRPLLQIARGGFLVTDQVIFSVTLTLIGLAEISALYATAPLLTVALAAPLLGERIGWRHWLAVVIGFLGALVIIRPGAEVFQPASAVVLIGALMYAFYSLATRLVSHTDTGETSLLYTSLAGVVVTTPFGLADFRMPGLVPWVWLIGALASSLIALVLVIRAYALAPASLLQPFNYVLLAAGTLIGVLAFGERPDLLAYAGMGLIALAGLDVALHEARGRGRA